MTSKLSVISGSKYPDRVEPQRRALGARPATIGQHGPDGLVARTMPSDVQIDRVALRIGVIDRHGDATLVDPVAQRRPFDGVVERNHCRLGSHRGGWCRDAGDVASNDDRFAGIVGARREGNRRNGHENETTHCTKRTVPGFSRDRAE